MLFGGDETHCFVEKTSRDYEKEKLTPFWRYFSTNHNQPHPNVSQKKWKSFHLCHNQVDFPLNDTNTQNFISSLLLYTFSL